MSQSHFNGPLASGDQQPGGLLPTGFVQNGTGSALNSTPKGNSGNVGLAALAQTAIINQNGVGTVTTDFIVPPNSQIIQIAVDVLVPFDSVTSALLAVGTPAAPPGYLSGVNAKTAGRATLAPTAGQLLAWADTGAVTIVRASVAALGATTQGSVKVTILYVQTR